MRRMMAGALVVIGLEVIALAVIAYSGAYDVSATRRESSLGASVVRLLQAKSVERRASAVPTNPVSAEAVPPRGAEAYAQLCAACHSAPGVARSDVGSGLSPRPVDLSQVAPRWSDRELFWIVKHGIRGSGMPAFGPTRGDDEIWDVVTFVRVLPTLSARDYARLVGGVEAIHDVDTASALPRSDRRASPARPED